ncbi:Nop14-like family [Fragilaria crotonensis]|nr:Nop14-like family [Fragilaria crotonensis]
MAKRKTKAKRSLASLPKGLPSKNRADVNLFEIAKSNHGGRRAKHEVNNRFTTQTTSSLAKPSKLAESLQRRQSQQRAALQSSKKVNSFVDRRIGEFNMSQEDKMMARLVKERIGRSKRASKYSLNDNDDNDNQLTHRGKAIDQTNIMNHVILDSDEEDGGNLDAMDTEMNFGGLDDGSGEINPYKPSGGQHNDMSQVYSQKKNDLDEMIKRRKIMKAERLMSKERQEETFESLDQGFDELAQLLQFRDKESDRKANLEKKRTGQVMQGDEKNTMDQEMQEWDREMKTYLFERKVKATDRTKTPEEIAKEEADRLHELETKRLARMNGDFEHDHLSDISDDEGEGRKKKRQKKKRSSAGAETLDDSDDDHEEEKLKVKFTADGLVYVDKDGKFVKKVGDEDAEDHDDDGDGDEPTSDEEAESDASDEDNDDEGDEDGQKPDPDVILEVGARVKANYRANEQFDGHEAWHDGKIAQVHTDKSGNVTYDVDYDDGDYEDGVQPKHVRLVKLKTKEQEKEEKKKEEEIALKRKRQKAREKARGEIPFVFEVPTTLDALHDMIGNYASTGPEVSLIINRIHASNSVRLNKKNTEKMQNFYDVLLRRFVAVGDAIYASGSGAELERYEQLNALTKTLFAMSSDAPESAAAVWGRRLGVFHNAHAKRLRDVDFVQGKMRSQVRLALHWYNLAFKGSSAHLPSHRSKAPSSDSSAATPVSDCCPDTRHLCG